MNRPLNRLVCTCVILILASCTHFKVPNQQIGDQNHWRANGKLGIVANGKPRSVNFDWLNQADDFDIRLTGTFGIGNARLRQRENQIELHAKGEIHRAQDAQTLLYRVTGLDIPVSGLKHWIKGHRHPEATVKSIEHDDQGRLKHLSQLGWTIEFQR